MILGYKKLFPWGEPTNFKEKILTQHILSKMDPQERERIARGEQADSPPTFIPKIHSLREDKADQWHRRRNEYQKIHHSYYAAGMKHECFLVNECTGYQDISIYWNIKRFNDQVNQTISRQLPTAYADMKFKWIRKYMRSVIKNPVWAKSPRVANIIHDVKFEVYIDSILAPESMVDELWRNDGFASLTEFMRYFNNDWSGKIVHWTEYRYTFPDHIYERARELNTPKFTSTDIHKIVALTNTTKS